MKHLIIFILFLLNSCMLNTDVRKFQSSFESMNDFSGSYISDANHMGTASHGLSTDIVHSGTYSHKAWVYGVNPEGSALNNTNHRGYPTIQFWKSKEGSFRTPCYIKIWVYASFSLQPHSPENQWISFATIAADANDDWNRVVLVNLSYDGYVNLMHVPYQGQAEYTIKNTSVIFPMNQWVEIKIYLDFKPYSGYAKVWQDGQLISAASVAGGNGYLTQAHFGLYAAPSVSNGVIYNDDLSIEEVLNE